MFDVLAYFGVGYLLAIFATEVVTKYVVARRRNRPVAGGGTEADDDRWVF